MNESVPNSPVPAVEVHGARATSVIVHNVPADSVDHFLEWQRGITRIAEGFPGYQATEVYPPAEQRQQEWVVVLHFNDSESLQRWLESSARLEWTARLPSNVRDFQLKTLTSGFGPWFAGMVGHRGGTLPPSWKMFLTVLLGLYPTVMLLSITIGPLTAPLGLALSMLIGNALSVAILQWAVVPALEYILRPWLRVAPTRGRAFAVGGLVLILALLAVLTLLFHMLKG